MALIVVGHRAAATRFQRQAGLGAIQGLDLAVLIHAQHHEEKMARKRKKQMKNGTPISKAPVKRASHLVPPHAARGAGLTQAQVAQRAKTTASAISRYENAEYDRYELRTLQRIVLACGGRLDITLAPGPNSHRAA